MMSPSWRFTFFLASLACLIQNSLSQSINSTSSTNSTNSTLPLRPETSRWPLEDCTDKSFTIPSWLMYNFTIDDLSTWPIGPSYGIVSFVLVNRVTNVWANMSCEVSVTQKSCTSGVEFDDSLQATIHIDNARANISISQTWTCVDKMTLRNETVPFTFSAVGNISIPVRCGYYANSFEGIGKCRGDDKLIRGSLQQPFDIKPVNGGPPGHALPECRAFNSRPRWRIEDFSFYNSTVYRYPFFIWWIWVPNLAYSASLVNVGSDFKTNCGYMWLSYGDAWHIPEPLTKECSSPYWPPMNDLDGRIETNITFDLRTKSIAVEQVWWCEDEGSLAPVKVTALGSTEIEFNCTVEDWGETTVWYPWEQQVPGLLTTCGIMNGSASFTGAIVSREIRKPMSLTELRPGRGGCTIESMTTPSYSLYSYGIASYDSIEDPSNIELSFSLRSNHAEVTQYVNTNYSISMSRDGPAEWTSCGQREDTCRFKFNFWTRKLEINEVWTCNDKDPDKPIQWNSTVVFTLPPYTCRTPTWWSPDRVWEWSILYCSFTRYVDLYSEPVEVLPGRLLPPVEASDAPDEEEDEETVTE